jgi:high-affinity iron transporter
MAGGCNPIPLKSTNRGGQVTIAAADLKTLAAVFGK